MPGEQPASSGVIREAVATPAVETASTAVAPVTATQSISTSNIASLLGIPADVQAQLEANREPEAISAEPQPADPPVTETEPTPVDPPEDALVEPPKDEQEKDVWPESAKTRVDKLTRQKNEWKEKVEELENELTQVKSQLEQAPPVTVAPSATDVLAHVQTPEDLQQIIEQARVARNYCRENPEGAVVNEGKDNERIITPKEMAQTLSQVEDVLAFEVPKKQAELAKRSQSDSYIKTVYPQLFDRSSEDFQVAQAMFRQIPGLYSHPDRNAVVGDYLRGLRMRMEENQKAAKPKVPIQLTAKTPPLAPPVPTASRGDAVPSRKKVDQAMNNLAQSNGTANDIAAVLKARRLAKVKTGAQDLVPV